MTAPQQRERELPEGEPTENWHCNRGGFWGTVNQLTRCARCGEIAIKRRDEPVRYRDVFKPTLHMICDACYEELPE